MDSLLPPRIVLRPLTVLVTATALSACASTKPAPPDDSDYAQPPPRHAAHGHVIAAIEHDDGGAFERVEDEDTQWVDLPDFGQCPYEEGNVPPYEAADDGHVPGLDPQRSRLTNMDAGDATIHNEALLQLLNQATAQVLQCVSVSACYDDRALEPGSIDLRFELAPNGDVRGVDVEPTPGMDHTGIRECARLAIWDTEFPSFDGADMMVSYQLDID